MLIYNFVKKHNISKTLFVSYFVFATVAFYFLIVTLFGQKGLVKYFGLKQEIANYELTRQELAEKVDAKKNLVAGMNVDSLDLDLLDEEARRSLGFANKNEVVVYEEKGQKTLQLKSVEQNKTAEVAAVPAQVAVASGAAKIAEQNIDKNADRLKKSKSETQNAAKVGSQTSTQLSPQASSQAVPVVVSSDLNKVEQAGKTSRIISAQSAQALQQNAVAVKENTDKKPQEKSNIKKTVDKKKTDKKIDKKVGAKNAKKTSAKQSNKASAKNKKSTNKKAKKQ